MRTEREKKKQHEAKLFMAIKLRSLMEEVRRVLRDDPSLACAARTIDTLIQTAGRALAREEPNMAMVMGAFFAARVIARTLTTNPMLDSAAFLVQLESMTEVMIAEAMKRFEAEDDDE